jgi:hypothetical protein
MTDALTLGIAVLSVANVIIAFRVGWHYGRASVYKIWADELLCERGKRESQQGGPDVHK